MTRNVLVATAAVSLLANPAPGKAKGAEVRHSSAAVGGQGLGVSVPGDIQMREVGTFNVGSEFRVGTTKPKIVRVDADFLNWFGTKMEPSGEPVPVPIFVNLQTEMTPAGIQDLLAGKTSTVRVCESFVSDPRLVTETSMRWLKFIFSDHYGRLHQHGIPNLAVIPDVGGTPRLVSARVMGTPMTSLYGWNLRGHHWRQHEVFPRYTRVCIPAIARERLQVPW